MSINIFRNRPFTLMLIGQIVSLLGNALLRFALSLYVLDRSGSAALFGGVLALSALPQILLSPLGGVLADRLPRQKIMYLLDFLTAALTALFTLLGRNGSLLPPTALLLALAAIQSCYSPSVQSAVPLLIPQESLTQANGAVAQVQALSGLLGPVAGAALYDLWGLGPICAVSALCFLASAVMECFLRIPFVPPKTKGSLNTVLTDLREAGTFLSRRGLLPLLAVIAGVNLFLSSLYTVGLPCFVKVYLGLSSQLYSLIEAATGLGSILGALLTGLWSKYHPFRRSWLALFLSTLSLAAMAIATLSPAAPMASWALLLASSLWGTTFATLCSILLLTFFQLLTPPDLLGKVSSFLTTVATCAMPLGQALYGGLLDLLPPAAVCLLALLACLPLTLAGRRQLSLVSLPQNEIFDEKI